MERNRVRQHGKCLLILPVIISFMEKIYTINKIENGIKSLLLTTTTTILNIWTEFYVI